MGAALPSGKNPTGGLGFLLANSLDPKGPTPPPVPAPPPAANPPQMANKDTAAAVAKNKASAAGLAGQTNDTGAQGLKAPTTGKSNLLGDTAT